MAAPESQVEILVGGEPLSDANPLPTSGGVGGGGGGAVTVADGDDVALGALADAAITTNAAGSVSGKLRGIVAHLVTLLARLPAALGANGGLKVEGVASGTVIPISDGGGLLSIDDGGGTITVDGTFFQATQPVSIAAGSDITLGNTSDAAVTTDTTGTVSGKLRGLVKWAFERMPASLGQKAKAAALPVTLASDEDILSRLPAALAAGGGLKVEGVAGGVAQPVSGTVTAAQETYATVTTGEFAPGVSAAQFPTITAKLVRIKARAANTGAVYVGDDASVTVADGTTDTTAGLQLAAGDDTGWIPVANLNKFYGIGAGASDSVTYMVLA